MQSKIELAIPCNFDMTTCESCGQQFVLLGILPREDGDTDWGEQYPKWCPYCRRETQINRNVQIKQIDGIISTGQKFIITSGFDDEYRIVALCQASVDIDFELTRQKYLELHPNADTKGFFDENDFVSWLKNDKAAVILYNYSVLHLGPYRKFSPGFDGRSFP